MGFVNEYEGLCATAAKRDLFVEIIVNDGKPLGDKGREYRVAKELRLTDSDGKVIAHESLRGINDRGRAARVLRSSF